MSTRDFLKGGGDMGALVRGFEWAAHPLGEPDAWPQSLKSAVSICLGSRFPILVWWGPELFMIYNDAYRPILGTTKHPGALGQAGRRCWPEIWHIIGPMLEGTVLRDGDATWSDDQLLVLDRNGFPEECYFTFTYSPIRDESGGVGGVFCAVIETTPRVVGERRLRLLKDLAAETVNAVDAMDACVRAATVLASSPRDLAFALIYLFDEDTARLVARTPSSEAIEVATVIPRSGERVFAALPIPSLVAPIAAPGQAQPTGWLVAGLNPQRPVDDDYRSFVALVAGQIASAVADARALATERARAEALAEIDRAKTMFFSNVSHELRTPLTLMLGPTEDALASPERALTAENLEIVHRNELRLLKLVNTLLDFSRLEAGRAEARYEPTDLAALTAELASTFRSAVTRAGLEFAVDCAPLSQPVFVDGALWEKIVLNLLSNALKFTPAGRIEISLREAEGAVHLRVRDTGIGIPASELPHVFERFHRVQGQRARTHEGSGIGLALVNELVRMHGGTIDVASTPGDGSTFTVAIPTGRSHLPADRVGARRSDDAAGRRADLYVEEALGWLPAEGVARVDDRATPGRHDDETNRIVFVDDNRDMRDYVRRLLSDRWTVDAYADGAAALTAVRDSPPALVIADIMMPGVDGFELVRELQAQPATANVPVILVSARAGEEARIEGIQAGASDYLVKPFSARELRGRVEAQILRAQVRAAHEAHVRRLAQMFNQAPVAIAILRGPEHIYEFANEPYLQLVGGRPVTGQRLLEALPELAGQGVVELLDRVRVSKEPYTASALRVNLNRGAGGTPEEAIFKFVYQPVLNPDGSVDSIAVIAIDVTELAMARREAEAANRAKDEFIAMLSHELRNPLSPIMTALQLMRLRGVTGAERERTIIERQVGHLVGLVDDLLDVSRITKGKIDLKKDHLEIAEVVANAIETASPLLEERQHTLDVHVPRHGCSTYGDRERLSQVLANLLTNAAKYTEPRGAIHIRADREGESLIVSVRDNGIGIAPEMLETIFETFTQGGQALDRAQGGLGLGLAIVRSLVALHGGSVHASSDGRGTGTAFTVRLPYVAMPSEGAAASTSPVAQPDVPVAAHILIVDDNQDSADMLAEVLGALGYSTQVRFDAPGALEAIEHRMPDVALLDIGLPVMDGYELARRIRARGGAQRMALVAVTGYGQSSDRAASQAAGFDAHLVKPIDLDQLVQLVATLTERRSQQSPT